MSETRKPREFKRAPYAIITATATALNITPRELGVRLGYTDSVVYAWEKDGDIPAVAELACKYLTQSNGVAPTIWLVYLTSAEHRALLDMVAKNLGLTPTTL